MKEKLVIMNEDFVTYEIALKLKEKGFRKPCIAHYCCLDGNVLKFNITTDCIRGSNVKCLNGENNIYTDAPTISQVLKWLRKEKKIYIVIAVNPTLSTKDKIAYYYQVYSNSNGVTSDYYESEECYAQWEECAIDSIKYVLGNLI